MKFFKGVKFGKAEIDIFKKMRIQSKVSKVSKVRFEKTRLLHLRNVEKPPHSQFFAIIESKLFDL